jgi:hypothetical protein
MQTMGQTQEALLLLVVGDMNLSLFEQGDFDLCSFCSCFFC